MTDAAHMASDLASFMISLCSMWIASKPATIKMTYGFHRAEIVGALMSILLIWLLTAFLVKEAIDRVIEPQPVHGGIMFITALGGVFVNIIMGCTLGSHGHSHAGSSPHSSHHDHKIGSEHSHGHSHGNHSETPNRENINIRAAYIHVLGDLVQSVGVLIAASIIWYKPEWNIVDPISTFLFSVIVLFTTVGILKDTVNVLMEGTPSAINPDLVKAELLKVPGVLSVHDFHCWSLTMSIPSVSMHLQINLFGPEEDRITDPLELTRRQCNIVLQAEEILCKSFGIHHTTIQIEPNVSSHRNSHCFGCDS
eukprot:Sdes_comp18445_c1_seq1m8378